VKAGAEGGARQGDMKNKRRAEKAEEEDEKNIVEEEKTSVL